MSGAAQPVFSGNFAMCEVKYMQRAELLCMPEKTMSLSPELAFAQRLSKLKWEQRLTLRYIHRHSDEQGVLTHPAGKAVIYLIAEGIDRHPATVYRYVKELAKAGFVIMKRHEKEKEHGRNHGCCVTLVDAKSLYDDERGKSILSCPPGTERWLAPVMEMKESLEKRREVA